MQFYHEGSSQACLSVEMVHSLGSTDVPIDGPERTDYLAQELIGSGEISTTATEYRVCMCLKSNGLIQKS